MNRCLRRWPAGLVLLAAAAPLTLLLTGCQAPSHTAEVVVVLPSATANEPAPMLAPADRALLYQAGAASTRGVAFVINPATGQPTRVGLTKVGEATSAPAPPRPTQTSLAAPLPNPADRRG